MKKINTLIIASAFLFVGTGSAIYADSKIVPEGKTVTLNYGSASAIDTRTDHSYNYQTKGTCNSSRGYLYVSVSDSSGKVRSSDSAIGIGAKAEATWFASGKVSHTHNASSNPIN